jgi:ATP/maltotriose-dependent transcriptional regulator MalT
MERLSGWRTRRLRPSHPPRRKNGLPIHVLIATGYLAEAEYRLGNWDDAMIHDDLAVSLVEDTDQFWFRAFAHSIAAMVWAARGDWKVAETHVAAAGTAAQRLGNEASYGYAANAAAHLAFARQDRPGIVKAAQPLYQMGSRNGVFEPGVLGWREPYDEALIALGHVAEACRDLREAHDLASCRGRRAMLARLSRPRAALALASGDTDQARHTLEDGIEQGATACIPFDQVLLHEALGRLLRRQGERRRAASHLQAAQDRYRRLRAAPFLSRCGTSSPPAGCTRCGALRGRSDWHPRGL